MIVSLSFPKVSCSSNSRLHPFQPIPQTFQPVCLGHIRPSETQALRSSNQCQSYRTTYSPNFRVPTIIPLEHSSRNNLIHHRYLNYGPALFLPPLSTVSLVYQQSLLPSCLSASPSVHLSLAPLLDSSLILPFPRISLDLIIPFPIMDICGDPLYSLPIPLFPIQIPFHVLLLPTF